MRRVGERPGRYTENNNHKTCSNRYEAYSDMRGNPWRQPVGHLVLHVVNHATHHRGQVSGFLRAMGHTPPKIDLVFYYLKVD